jgi:ribosome-binding protein aMBF1 (putative translation factor)
MSYGQLTLDGKRYVLVPESEFNEIRRVVKPALPPADAEGNRPAVAFATASIARSIVRDRESVGMTQRALAEAAGIRVEILNRAERGVVVPSTRTLTKIEVALVRAGLKRGRGRRSK